MKKSKSIVAVPLLAFGLLATGHAAAADKKEDKVTSFLDYRHQYEAEDKEHRDMFGLKIYTSSVMWELINYHTSGKDSKPLEDIHVSSTEIGAYIPYKINKKFSLVSGLVGGFGSGDPAYIASFKLGYKHSKDFAFATKYRFVQGTGSIRDKRLNRFDGYVTYKGLDLFNVQYQYNYTMQTGDEKYKLFDNDTKDYFHQIRIKGKFNKTWKPFIEFRDMKVNNKSDDRQMRYTAGIQYYF
ncbi:TPA: oligogalacturonate-specific porin KdgM family protein [Vibrio parahaemolyticus]